MLQADKIIKESLNLAKDNIYSTKKAEEDRTERLRIDNTSTFKLPHLIRPIAFIWGLALQTILSIYAIITIPDQLLIILGSNTAIVTTMVGFYFNGRKQEKIIAKQSAAAIKIEEEKVKQERVKEKRAFRLQRMRERKK
jgi:hypothetical protein